MKFVKAIANNKEMFEIYCFNKAQDIYGYKQFANVSTNGYSPKWEEVSRKVGLCSGCIAKLAERVEV